jgi:predicted Zn-ribbon and HTH transcriptional regulator
MTDKTERREFLKSTSAALVSAAGIGILASTSCNQQPTKIRNPTRQKLIERLEKLAKSKPPKNLVAAMCYEMACPAIVEKPCSICERTMIVGEKDEILREYNVPLKRIQDQGIDAKLIIPEHCPECGYGLKEEQFQLTIKYPDQRDTVQVELESAFDLELMALFLHGQDRYEELWKGGGGQEHPLKDKVERLRELFGVTSYPVLLFPPFYLK